MTHYVTFCQRHLTDMRTLTSGNLKNFCADVYSHLSMRGYHKLRHVADSIELIQHMRSSMTFHSGLRSSPYLFKKGQEIVKL